jgi:hypothetical protein
MKASVRNNVNTSFNQPLLLWLVDQYLYCSVLTPLRGQHRRESILYFSFKKMEKANGGESAATIPKSKSIFPVLPDSDDEKGHATTFVYSETEDVLLPEDYQPTKCKCQVGKNTSPMHVKLSSHTRSMIHAYTCTSSPGWHHSLSVLQTMLSMAEGRKG